MNAAVNRSKPPLGPVGILCPNPACRATRSRVVCTRQRPDLTRRIRQCLACRRRFRTAERNA